MTERRAGYVAVTFPEQGKIILKVGPGDHSCDRWEITPEQLRLIVLDAIPKLLTD